MATHLPGAQRKIAYWIPVLPPPGGSVNHTATFLEALSEIGIVEVFTFTARTVSVPNPNEPYSVWPFGDYPVRALRRPFDLNVYQIGNGGQAHEYVYRRALEQPGLAVLDDESLFNLHLTMLWARGHLAQFWNEVDYCEGDEARRELEQAMPAIARGELEPDRERFSLVRRLIDNSRAVLVRSSWQRDELRQRFPFRKIEASIQDVPAQDTTRPVAAEWYRSLFAEVIGVGDRYTEAHPPPPIPAPLQRGRASMPGVNLIGDLSMAIGLSEAALNMLEAMLTQRIPVAYTELLYAANRQMHQAGSRAETLTARLPRGTPFPINLLHFNLNELALISESQMRAVTDGKYTIANWFWELDQVPVHLRAQVGRVDEIWVSSTFARRGFAALTSRPVEVIPLPIAVQVSRGASRASCGLPKGRYIFFYHFSATSCDSRKNPGAIIRAFEQAFGSPAADGPLLVIKAQHLSLFPEMHSALTENMARVGGLLITDNYTRQQMNDLLSCIDAYVSLHRAEAFGAGMAEAMYLGKPVIATDYSGNTDFITADNSYPVRYQLRLVTADDSVLSPDCQFLYEPGQVWAEPDVHHAADWMTFLYTHPGAGQDQGQRAADSIRRYCEPEIIGRLIARRLSQLAQLVSAR